MARIKTKRRGKKSEKRPRSPTMLLSKMLPKDLMRSAVLGFLDLASVASFIEVKEFSQVFRLHRYFCKNHGTRLIGQPEKQCADCEMPKIGKTRCGNCDDFSKKDHFGNCNVCEMSECDDCIFFCVQCCNNICCECNDSCHCENCKMALCHQCEDMFECPECYETYCYDCRELNCCEVCETTFYRACKDHFFCEKCEASFCLECKERLVCENCEKQVCNDDWCNDLFSCSRCEEYFCLGCRQSVPCSDECDYEFCSLECAKQCVCGSPKGGMQSSEAS